MKQTKTVFTVRSLAALFMGEARYRRWLDTVRDVGFDAIALDVVWQMVERERGDFDFSLFDRLIGEIVRRGMGVQLKANTRLSPHWVSPKYAQRLCDGKTARVREVFDKPVHTLADDSLNGAMADFFHETARHYSSLPVVGIQPLFAYAFESEYEFYQYADYSRYSVRAFRRWLERHYRSPEALNRAWGTRYASFRRVPILFDGARPNEQPDTRAPFIDFMKYREDALKNFVDRMAKAAKSGGKNVAFAVQVGKIFSPCAARRGSVGVFYWGREADEIIVDPSPADRVGFVADSIRNSGKIRSVELDGPYVYRQHHRSVGRACIEQAARAARHGADRLYIANYVGPQETARYAKTLAQVVEIFHSTRALKPSPETLFISKWDVYGRHENPIPACNYSPPDGRPLNILTEDLLS